MKSGGVGMLGRLGYQVGRVEGRCGERSRWDGVRCIVSGWVGPGGIGSGRVAVARVGA